MGLEIRVLGAPTVSVAGDALAITGRPLQLLVRLALASPVPLPASRLVDELWGEHKGSVGALRVTVARAREAVGRGALVCTDNGYLIRDCKVDARWFERLAHAGRDRSTPIDRRIRTYEQALAEWNGEPFAGMGDSAWLEAERVRLEELREQVEDERFELLLLGDGHLVAAPELRQALARTPTREQRAGMLAIALYRCGRQAEALEVVASTRRYLLEHLGLDLGEGLRAIETRILQQDSRLAVPQLTSMQAAEEEVEAKLRAATALLRAGVHQETASILDDAEAVARTAGHRRSLCNALIVRSQLRMWSGSGDPAEPLQEARRTARQMRDGRLLALCALTDFARGLDLEGSSALVGLLEPIPLLPTTAPEVVQLVCCAAALVMFSATPDSSNQLLDQAERLHRLDKSDRSAAVVLVVASMRESVDGTDPRRSSFKARTAFELARSVGDPALMVVTALAAIRASYMLGDFEEVDRLLADLEDVSRLALVPFGVVRVALCRATNALARGLVADAGQLWAEAVSLGGRLRTYVTETAARSQQLMLMLEADQLDAIGAAAERMLSVRTEPSIWNALRSLSSAEEADALAEALLHLRRDDSFAATVAVAALAASAHRQRELAHWCLEQLIGDSELTIVIGLGTIVMGYRSHFKGLALAALDRHVEARHEFLGATNRAAGAGLWLWWATSQVEGAASVTALGDQQTAASMLRQVKEHPVFAESVRLRRRVDEVERISLGVG